MYNNIKEFREFISGASDEQIERAIDFINMASFFEGVSARCCCDNMEYPIKAIEYAKSEYSEVESFMRNTMGATDEFFFSWIH